MLDSRLPDAGVAGSRTENVMEHERSSCRADSACRLSGEPLVRCCELVRRAAVAAPEALSFFCDASW